jgi:hypothetical protein
LVDGADQANSRGPQFHQRSLMHNFMLKHKVSASIEENWFLFVNEDLCISGTSLVTSVITAKQRPCTTLAKQDARQKVGYLNYGDLDCGALLKVKQSGDSGSSL